MRTPRGAGTALFPAIVAVGFGVALATVSSAQTIRATLTGTVTDANGGIVQGAGVTATNAATNISTATKTSREGTYTFTALPPGEYTVEVSMSGFKTQRAKRHRPADRGGDAPRRAAGGRGRE
jgi:protocatechuate 3,4-dioxygenase beta subunit